MKILKYITSGALQQGETGPDAQVGDQVKLFLDTTANTAFPEYIFGIIQPGIKKVGSCQEETQYYIEYDEANLDGAQELIRQGDVTDVVITAAIDVVAEDLLDEVEARIAADTSLDTLKAPKASPTFTGDPKAPTPSTTDNDTSIATTAFVQAQPVVRYMAQTLSSPQKVQARTNLGIEAAINWDSRQLISDLGLPVFDWSDGFELDEGVNILVGTTTGSSFGDSTSQKISFHGATPVIQRAGAAQAAVVTTTSTQTTPWGFNTQAQANAIITLLNEIRTTLVEKGIMKGSA